MGRGVDGHKVAVLEAEPHGAADGERAADCAVTHTALVHQPPARLIMLNVALPGKGDLIQIQSSSEQVLEWNVRLDCSCAFHITSTLPMACRHMA